LNWVQSHLSWVVRVLWRLFITVFNALTVPLGLKTPDRRVSGDKTRYSKHLDWHFRQNRRDKAKPNSTAASMRRNWYYRWTYGCSSRKWPMKRTRLVCSKTKEHVSDVEEETPESTVIAEKDESLNCCAVCGESLTKIERRGRGVETQECGQT